MFNAQSVANKLLELHFIMYNDDYDCIVITETWLHTGICDGAIDPRGLYSVIRKDRVGVRGGGVCILVRRKYQAVPIVFKADYCELEIIGVTFHDFHPKLDIFAVYRPPNRDCEAKQYMQLLIDCLKTSTSNTNMHVIVGDFNLPQIEWNTLACPSDAIHNPFLEFIIQHSWIQLVNFPTRCQNVLDLVITDVAQVVTQVTCKPPIACSDHVTVEILLALTSRNSKHVPVSAQTPAHNQRYLWHFADYDSMCKYLFTIDWSNVVCYNPEVSQLWATFSTILSTAVNAAVPTALNNHNRHNMTNARHSRMVHNCVTLKRKYWKELAERPWDSLLRQKYRDVVYKYRKALQQYHTVVEERLISTNQLGAFYRYINKRITNSTSVGAIVQNDAVLTDDSSKANALNDHFASVYTVDDGITPVCKEMELTTTLDAITVEVSEVMSSIDRLKNNCSSGPDGFPPVMYRRLKQCLSVPLTLMYNQFLSVGYVPLEWRTAHIVPVHKKGTTGDVNNYRPISLTCVSSKILERIVANRILDYLVSNNILHPAQHGFMKQRSTCTNLLESVNDWTLCVQTKQQVSIVYVDFTKAFDVVSHNKLFSRLHSYGIRGSLLIWLKNFLTGRTHQTKVGCDLSDVAELLSGIVQGSGMGPCMFLIYINELLTELSKYNITVKAFADDVKMYVQILDDLDVQRLQLAVDVLCQWATSWQLSISINKCCVLNVGKSVCDVSISINDGVVPVVESARDLGVQITKSLSPSVHINDIVSRANQRAAAILRAFVSRDVRLLMRAFITYVRPIVEYNSSVWSPSSVGDIESVERVQRRFTKRLPGLKNMSYDQRLKFLDVPSLELRRLRADLYWCYKILFGLVTVTSDAFFTKNFCTSTRGHQYKLYKHHTSACVRSNFFAERVVNEWNNLPESVDFSTLSRFKRTIKRVRFSNIRF